MTPLLIESGCARVQRLWSQFFADLPLVEPKWFESCNFELLAQALAITAEQDKAGRFKVRNQDNIGRYVLGVVNRLKNVDEVEKARAGIIDVRLEMRADYKITENEKRRFQEKLVSSGDCLLFKSATHTGNYGRFWVNGGLLGAHVFALFSDTGYLPAKGERDQLEVAHKCRSRRCCNPKHLRLTTKSLNLSERIYGQEAEPSAPAAEIIVGTSPTSPALSQPSCSLNEVDTPFHALSDSSY